MKFLGLDLCFEGIDSSFTRGGEERGEAKAPRFGAVMLEAPKRSSRGEMRPLRRRTFLLLLVQMKRMARRNRAVIPQATAIPIIAPSLRFL